MAENTRGQTGILDRLFAVEISGRSCIEVIAFHGFASYQCLVFHCRTLRLAVSTSKSAVANSPKIAFRQIRKIRFSGPLPTRTAARKLREHFVGLTPTMIFENKLKVGFMPVTLSAFGLRLRSHKSFVMSGGGPAIARVMPL
jgi:hypothetical protein